MPEASGGGRLDRIEKLLEDMAERTATTTWLHEKRLLQIAVNIEQMRDDEKAYRVAQREVQAALDKRVSDLVAAIGNWIAHIPPASLGR